METLAAAAALQESHDQIIALWSQQPYETGQTVDLWIQSTCYKSKL